MSLRTLEWQRRWHCWWRWWWWWGGELSKTQNNNEQDLVKATYTKKICRSTAVKLMLQLINVDINLQMTSSHFRNYVNKLQTQTQPLRNTMKDRKIIRTTEPLFHIVSEPPPQFSFCGGLFFHVFPCSPGAEFKIISGSNRWQPTLISWQTSRAVAVSCSL